MKTVHTFDTYHPIQKKWSKIQRVLGVFKFKHKVFHYIALLLWISYISKVSLLPSALMTKRRDKASPSTWGRQKQMKHNCSSSSMREVTLKNSESSLWSKALLYVHMSGAKFQLLSRPWQDSTNNLRIHASCLYLCYCTPSRMEW